MSLWNKSAQRVYCLEHRLTLAFPSGEGGLTRRSAEVKTDEESEIKQQAFSPHPSAESLRFAPLAATFPAGEGFYMLPHEISIFNFPFSTFNLPRGYTNSFLCEVLLVRRLRSKLDTKRSEVIFHFKKGRENSLYQLSLVEMVIVISSRTSRRTLTVSREVQVGILFSTARCLIS